MNFKDLFKTSFINTVRNKKNISYVLLMTFCSLITLLILFFGTNLLNLVNHDLINSNGYRTFYVFPKYDDEKFSNYSSKDKRKEIDKLRTNTIEEIKKYKYISQVVKTEYNEFFVTTTDFKSKGNVTMLYSNSNNLPKLVKGRTFKNQERKVAICPVNFFPDLLEQKNIGVLGIPLIKKTDLFSINDLLNKEITISYDKYEKSTDLQMNVVETISENYKIVGLYNNGGSMNPTNQCYVPGDDIMEMCHKSNLVCADDQEHISLTELIDDYSNIETFKQDMKKLNLDISENIAYSENSLNKTILYALIILIVLVLFTVFIINFSYVKKKVSEDLKIIGILRSSGYNKKQIKNIYLVENAFLNIYSFVTSLILFFIIIKTLDFNFMAGLIIKGIYFKVDFMIIVYSFLFIVILSILISNISLNAKLKQGILYLIGSRE